MRSPSRVLPRAVSRVAVFLMFALILVTTAAQAAPQPDSKGTDFWLAFPSNYSGGGTLSLFITGDTNTSGTVSVPGIGFSTPFSVTAGTVTTVVLPSSAQLSSYDGVEARGIHVTAVDEVTVYGLNRIQYTTDAYLGLPTDILGTDYIVLGYKNTNIVNASQFAVVATVDATTLMITPSVSTGPHPAGVPYPVVLNQGETYQLVNTDLEPADLSGTLITSTTPVAVFGGHNCANIPSGYYACDHIVEQLPPTTAWGTNFVTMPLATRAGGDTFRFVASIDGTTVTVNSDPAISLNRGQVYERIIAGPSQITSDKPILVSQYSNGSSYDGVTSDPFMMLIPPYEQFLAGYTVTTPASGFAVNYINVVAPNAAVGLIEIDGTPIPAGSFTAVGSTGFSGTQVPVALGSHNLTGPLPFAAFVYGFDSYDSYGYPGGMSLAPIARVTTITLTPPTGLNLVGTQHCVLATVFDQDGNPLEGVRVDFTVTGPNATTGFATTDASGEATFCYVGTSVGDDAITASVGNVTSPTVAKTWYDNQPPDLSNAAPTQACFWPPNHRMASVGIVGVTDPDGDPLTITITGITSDEPTASAVGVGGGNKSPDASGVGTSTASIRVERAGPRDGRVYAISFDVSDGQSTVSGTVRVGVPHDQSDAVCGVDSGQNYDATAVN